TGDFTATLTAVDFAGNAATTAILFHRAADNAPTGSIQISPTGLLLPGKVFTVTVNATDDHALDSIVFRSDLGTQTRSCYGRPTDSQNVAFTIPVTAAAGAVINTFADIKDAQGHTTTVGPVFVAVAQDSAGPTVSNLRPAAATTVAYPNSLKVGVDAT